MSIATVKSTERVDLDGTPVTDLKVELSQDHLITVQQYQPPGEDSLPLPDDLVVVVDGSPGQVAIAYLDSTNAGEAEPGEKRFYSRDSGGAIKAVIWLKADGSASISNSSGTIELKASGAVNINGCVIGTDGSVSSPAEVTAMSNAASVSLSTHMHTDAMGGTGAPVPGT